MKRKLPIIITVLALTFLGLSRSCPGPHMGRILESWETTNQSFRLRVDMHAEDRDFAQVVAGAYYVFLSAPTGSDDWREIMTFRHDDPNPIPRGQVRFVNDKTGYVFMGWMYAVTTDAGVTWSVWDSEKDLPKYCCNYKLIGDVKIEPDGTGFLRLNPISQRGGEVPELQTKDFGRHWSE